ncbi:uncharacterized protein CTHT_0006220 [Thermochaetoides thermophila DSM 1495]|uniref:Uncharacterized protein n=1 Tax=Chaetomium thermophilum (strain DSM 1495 / CBS 144.50 / IMI 039719) TaxID=759272 RepID=G0RYC7_CHATD|nr:hypothetical protein CTHT_0006220 [Thermochaetoides thermophila DSM 1495]EGS23913.1 hypothetical protein CTHT_0006220 [Thermochaetoides thermophila DSM 1495]
MSVLVRPRSVLRYAATLRLTRLPQIGQQRSSFATTRALLSAPRRSQYFSSGYTTSYDPSQETGRGPIFSKNQFGVPQFYPRDLKRRVDDYVVGQERAKKTICSVIFNHYQNLRRRQTLEMQEQRLREKAARQKYAEDREAFERANFAMAADEEFIGMHETSSSASLRGSSSAHSAMGEGLFEPLANDYYAAPEDFSPTEHVKIDKSNLLLIGPTGVGKTYILETLSKKLNVPFTISDCNSFTQAGYIGQDVESCIERLLIEANYDVKAAEHGIVVLDEFDKIAKKETVNGRDVGGEGVQQALLKLVEGTKVTINVKDHRSSRNAPPTQPSGGSGGSGPGYTSHSSTPQSSPPPTGKVEQYIVDTTNILFVFCGAFVGLDKCVLRRVAKPSIGFTSDIRPSYANNMSLSGTQSLLPPELYAHLPFQPSSPQSANFTPLDLTTPQDLQAYGFIPELIGRLHNICALSPLTLHELYRILTEPRNSLVAQYTALFETYPSRLYFTRRALWAIAENAMKNETGARGLKMEMERVLAEPMFDAPMPYVLITEGCVKGKEKAGYWGREGRAECERRLREEDEGFGEMPEGSGSGGGHLGQESFEGWREAGLSGA